MARAAPLRGASAACSCSAICRSTWRRTRWRPGRAASSSSSTPTAGRRCSPACRRIISPPTGSSGAIRCTTGSRPSATSSPSGARAWRHQLQRFDLVRIDHFRGLAAYWAVPAGARTAREGRWCPAPGHALFRGAARRFPDLPVVAEDLGVITPDVDELRRPSACRACACCSSASTVRRDNPHLPHNYTRDVVAYTGTHDNDTTVGWYRSLERAGCAARAVLPAHRRRRRVPDSMMRACLGSVAAAGDPAGAGSAASRLAGALQHARHRRSGNWSWRLPRRQSHRGAGARYAHAESRCLRARAAGRMRA